MNTKTCLVLSMLTLRCPPDRSILFQALPLSNAARRYAAKSIRSRSIAAAVGPGPRSAEDALVRPPISV
jgi:hypothetical protein